MNGFKSILRYFAGHPTAANLLMVLFLLLGFISIGDLKRETLPDFDSTMVRITAAYPGATAEDVEEAVVSRIEDALDEVNDVEEVVSISRENSAQVTVEMREGGDIDRFLNEVKTEVEAIEDFPDEMEDLIIKELNRTDRVLSIAVTGPMSAPDLKLYCEEIKDRLSVLPQISQVNIAGFSDHQIRIEIPSATLMQYGLSASRVADVISRQSLDLPAGVMETDGADYMVRFTDERSRVHEFEDLVVVGSDSGAEVRLGDIASITDRFELDEDKVLFNGVRAGLLEVNKSKTEDSLKALDAITDFLETERAQAPPGVKYYITYNVSKIVRDRLELLSENGLQGLALVFLTMWLFFSFRYSFWVAMGLPVSFMGAVFAMQWVGMTLNMITMVGLLLAIGLIMDDAIVISENIAVHLRRGEKTIDAVVNGTAEVGPGVFSSFLTTLFVFGSIAVFITGHIGQVLWVMPVVLILALCVSLVEAFLILPNHLAHSVGTVRSEKTTGFRARFNRGLDWFRENAQGRAVDWAINWRYLFIGLVIAAFLSSVALIAGGLVKFRAFPEIDGDVLQARILLPQGTPLERTEEVVEHVSGALKEVSRELTPLEPSGRELVETWAEQFNVNPDAGESGPHVATVTADLISAENRRASIDEITNLWREKVGVVADVIAINYKEPSIGPAGLAIDIRLRGPDLEVLKKASLELMDWLGRYHGVVDLSDDLRPGKPEIRLTMAEGAYALGIDAAGVARQLRAAFHGQKASEIQVGDESYEIDVRVPLEDQDSLADLDSFLVATASGELVPLTSVANIEWGRGWGRIQRVDSQRTVTIQGDVDTARANAGEIISDTVKRFMPELEKRYPGISFDLEGQAKEGSKTGASLRKAFLIGLFGVFLLLSIQFKSYIEPFVIISAIPLALIGVIWGHFLMGLDMSMPSTMGFVSLAGIVVNDSILLVTFVKRNQMAGKSLEDSARLASRERFRAVLLTSLTTIMGLVPLLTERSMQAQVLIPLATSIVFGLITSTVLVLYFVPCLYAVLGDFGLAQVRRDDEV